MIRDGVIKMSKHNLDNRGRKSAPAVSLNHYASAHHSPLMGDATTSFDDFQLPNFVSTPVGSSKHKRMRVPQASKSDTAQSGHAIPVLVEAINGTPEDVRGFNPGLMRRNLHMSRIGSSSSLPMNESVASSQSSLTTSTPLSQESGIQETSGSVCTDPLPSSPQQYNTTRLHVQSPDMDTLNFSGNHDIRSLAQEDLSRITQSDDISADFSMQESTDHDELPSSLMDRFSGGQSEFLLSDFYEDDTSEDHEIASSAPPAMNFSTSNQRFDTSGTLSLMTASATSPLAQYVHTASMPQSTSVQHQPHKYTGQKHGSAVGTSGTQGNQVLFDMQCTPSNVFKSRHMDHHYPKTEPRKRQTQDTSASSTSFPFPPYGGQHASGNAHSQLPPGGGLYDSFSDLAGSTHLGSASRRGPRQSLPFSSVGSGVSCASYTPSTESYETTDSSFEVLGAEASDAQMLPSGSNDAPYSGEIASECSSRFRRNVLGNLSPSDVNRDQRPPHTQQSQSLPHSLGINMFPFDTDRGDAHHSHSGMHLSTPKTSVHATAALMVPQSASKVEHVRIHGGEHFRQWMDFKRMDYDPFLNCDRHDICLARANLKKEYIMSGCYYKLESAENEGAKGSPKGRAQSPRSRPGKGKGRAGLLTHKLHLWQAVDKHKQPYRREQQVQESAIGLANLCQLHVTRALEQRTLPKRPLLSPDIATSSVTPPIVRILESKRFYCGSFFTRQGACQVADCILIVFPKNHRGDVRLQLKVWDEERQDKSKKCDIKAHLLSYVCWLYGISDQSGESLGQWPPNLTGACSFGRNSKPGDDHNEFLCINPFHYVKDFEHEKQLERNVRQRVSFCVKNLPCLEGEKPNRRTNKCQCYCLVSASLLSL